MIKSSFKNPYLVLVFAVVIAVLSAVLIPRMPVDILPQFIRKKQLSAYVTNNQYYFITNMQTLNDFENAALINGFTPLHQNYFAY